MKYLPFLIFFSILFHCAYSQVSPQDHDARIFKAGYRNIFAWDSARSYKPGSGKTDRLYYRPLEIDLWYPAPEPIPQAPMKYGSMLDLLQERSNRFQDDTVYHHMTSDLIQYICAQLIIADTTRLTQLKTSSYLNAPGIQQKFPLIVYMCSFNGMSYENVPMFEFLAAHGFVVACITSVGRYPGNMSTAPDDLMEQVLDGAFVIHLLKNEKNVDSSKIGLLGYSWGGLAALMAVQKCDDAKAILSLDGSEMHYYGESKEEDRDFDFVRNTMLNVNKISISYAYLESGYKQAERDVDTIYNPIPGTNSTTHYARYLSATHEDFSGLPSLVATVSGHEDKKSILNKNIVGLVLDFFNHYLKGEPDHFTTSLKVDFRNHIADSVYPVPLHSPSKNERIVQGIILDENSQEPLRYVNVGVPGKNVGTVTDTAGHFLLKMGEDMVSDSLVCSMVGYESQSFGLAKWSNQIQPRKIHLRKKHVVLSDVLVTAKAPRTKKLGNGSTSSFISFGFPLKFLGSEIGVRIALGSKPVILKSFHFNVSENRLDTAVFRLNIYRFKNGKPLENILQQNIIVGVGKRKGGYSIDLSENKLVLKDEILLSLEWVEGTSTAPHGAIFLSAGLLNSSTWHRLTSQGEWKKFSSVGVGFNIEVQPLNQK